MAWHTLFNPNGSLIEVFSHVNVTAVLIVIGMFDVVLFLVWRYARDQSSPEVSPSTAGGE